MSGKNSVIFRFFFRHNCNILLHKKIFLVSSNSCTSTLVCAPPQQKILPSSTTCAVDNFQRLRFGNIWSSDKFTENPKIFSHPTISQFTGAKTQINIYIYVAHHLPIYEVNGTSRYLPRQQKHPYKAIYKQRVPT